MGAPIQSIAQKSGKLGHFQDCAVVTGSQAAEAPFAQLPGVTGYLGACFGIGSSLKKYIHIGCVYINHIMLIHKGKGFDALCNGMIADRCGCDEALRRVSNKVIAGYLCHLRHSAARGRSPRSMTSPGCHRSSHNTNTFIYDFSSLRS